MPRKENVFVSQAIPLRKQSNHQEMAIANLYYYDDSKNNETMDAIRDWLESEMEIGNELDALDIDEKIFSFAHERD